MKTPIKAIRSKCMDCTVEQQVHVRLCPVVNCPLWDYRMASRPTSSPLYDKELFREHIDLRCRDFAKIIDPMVEAWKQTRPKQEQPEGLKRR